MILRGIIRAGSLVETAEGRLELILELQGVGPAQPRRVVVPHEVLVSESWLDPDDVAGRGLDAEIELADDGRWRATALHLGPGRVLRRPPDQT